MQSPTGLDHRKDGGDLGSGVLVAEVDPVSAAYGDSPDILPMSVSNWRFTIVGIHFTGGRFTIEIANDAAQGV